MKIYLDLEANAITNEIISIGMITENDDEFYSLVRPHTKLDHNIKRLTKITQKEADMAPTLEEVMSAVRRFLCITAPLDKIIFIHYGKNDKNFLYASQTFTKSEFTRLVLQYIIDRCKNVDKQIPQHFKRKSIGLRSAYLTMRPSCGDSPIQNHNALEDAQMLKWICENIKNYTLPEGVKPVKIERINMYYSKRKKPAEEQTNSGNKGSNWELTGKDSRVRHQQAAAIIPAIDDEKFRMAIVAKKKKKKKVNTYSDIYQAMNLAYPGKFNTAQKIFDTLNKIYNALDTNVAINGWTFERVEK